MNHSNLAERARVIARSTNNGEISGMYERLAMMHQAYAEDEVRRMRKLDLATVPDILLVEESPWFETKPVDQLA